MLQSIPRLEDYDISPKTGFLPEELPLERLEDPYYAPWEQIAQNLPALILTRNIRAMVDKLPLLSTDKLVTEPNWRRACSILSFLGHGYVWAGDEPSDHIPSQLAKPWVEVCEHFELPPIMSYAAVCLWNFKTLVPTEPHEWSLDNLATLTTFTGCIDESWFYLVSTAIERQGAECLTTGLEAIKGCRDQDPATVVKCLQKLAEAIDAINSSLGRMYEMCDPHIFYFRIRPFLAGWKNMAEAGLPNGVRYGDELEYRQVSGGSNAQSSLIQALDLLLNVEHFPTGTRNSRSGPALPGQGIRGPTNHSFIHDMRKYMPGPHRRFLEHLAQVADIRDFVTANAEKTPALVLSYDACLAMLRAFRDKHIQIVSRYIVIQAQAAQRNKAIGSHTKREGLAAAKNKSRGTGGTALLPFLKQARDETGDSAAGTWGKRLLSENRSILGMLATRRIGKHPFSSSDEDDLVVKKARAQEIAQQEEENSVVGLAGTWEMPSDESTSGHW
jgi:indoleamine 2,3-dioxygenase